MLNRVCNDVLLGPTRGSFVHLLALAAALALGFACKVHAQSAPAATKAEAPGQKSPECLPKQQGFLRARLSGATSEELNWGGAKLDCTGAARPDAEGARIRFTEAEHDGAEHWVIVFGISHLKEGQRARTLPVNVTLIREGSGEFYSTQGDDKCTIDDIRQVAITAIPRKTRSYKVTARGFCTEPARSLRGPGAILVSRFDFAGRIDYNTDDGSTP
ncbi:MAG TPA: hypothetical protein VFS47_00615 [Steroidobacteraceae bacterium]|jgi:hypothetical protein|nr:hypothetical protein [Steroidobacteraceae bacterium]